MVFPEKLNGDFDFTQTGGEFPSYWFAREPKLTKYYGVTKNRKNRLIFINFEEAIEFLQNYYIDPILEDRMIRRSYFLDGAFILASSYDTLEDDCFDYYIYDKNLKNQYIEYLFGKDPFIDKIGFKCSKGKIEIQKKRFYHYIHDENERYPYIDDIDDGLYPPEKYEVEYADAYPEHAVYHKEIYAFKLKYFLDSGINNYNNFKENELETRKKELELFRKIKRKKDLEEDLEEARVRALKEKEQKEKERNGQCLSSIILINATRNYSDLYMKEGEKLKDIYHEIKKYNLRHLSGNKHEIQDFIDKVIDCMYEKNYKNDRIKMGKNAAGRRKKSIGYNK